MGRAITQVQLGDIGYVIDVLQRLGGDISEVTLGGSVSVWDEDGEEKLGDIAETLVDGDYTWTFEPNA